jgi:membrane associated rhomboid family serine protease
MRAAATCCGGTTARAADGEAPLQQSSAQSPQGSVFDVRFHYGRRSWPTNPFRFTGAGQVAIETDFVHVRGTSQRSFRFPKREEHRVRKVDIVNVRTEAEDVIFDVVGVDDLRELGFCAADRTSAARIAALLPTRQTEAFAVAHAEREVFHDRIDYWSPSTPLLWILLAVNVGIYLWMWEQRRGVAGIPWYYMIGWGGGIEALLRSQQLVFWGSNVGRLTLHGQPWRLFTSMFLHGSLLHLGFNMLALWQVGAMVERIFGSMRFAVLYLLSGLAGSLASVLWNPHVNSVGASGAIFGIIGGLLAFIGRPSSGVPPTVVQNLRGSILPFLLFNIVAGFLYPHTDNAAHIGGLAGGWLAGHLLARPLHVPGQRTG